MMWQGILVCSAVLVSADDRSVLMKQWPHAALQSGLPLLAPGQASPEQVDDAHCAVQVFASSQPVQAFATSSGACDTVLNPEESARSYSTVFPTNPEGWCSLSMLDSQLAWCAYSNVLGEWMQMDLGTVMMVAGVVTQARNLNSPEYPGHHQYVTKYTVSTATDPSSFQQQGGTYDGNTDSSDAKVNGIFPLPVAAQYVRIYPTEWQKHMSMRAGVLGCPADAPTASPTTAASPPAASVGAVGDPHMSDVRGRTFDLSTAGKVTLLLVPKGSAVELNTTMLHVQAGTVRAGVCGSLYIQSLLVRGMWVQQEGGYSLSATNKAWARPTHPNHKWRATVGPEVRLTVGYGMTDGGVLYLNFHASGLANAKMPIGGLLGGEDDEAYEWAKETRGECLSLRAAGTDPAQGSEGSEASASL